MSTPTRLTILVCLLSVALDKHRSDAEEPAPTHWSYVRPTRPPLPIDQAASWPQNAIDVFILARLEQQDLAPSPPAEPARRLRRVYLDLIGLPPPIEAADAFLADPSPQAYAQVVDQLLASPQYGERWARPWLDLARYADTNGYQADQYRNVWPYRDWVLHAINEDMPFDQFTIEQLAGDLLPEPSLDQKIATGFHRLTTCNVEAGVDPEENRSNQVIDRVNTTGKVWLGTSLECAQCHDHKYDPFTQRDYYQVFACFNNTPLEVEGDDGIQYDFTGPKIELPSPHHVKQQRDTLRAQLDERKEELVVFKQERLRELPEWEKRVRGDRAPAPEGTDVSQAIQDILSVPTDRRTEDQKNQIEGHFLNLDPNFKQRRDEIAALEKAWDALKPVTTLVMIEKRKPRVTHVFKRGNFLDKGAKVQPGAPAELLAMSSRYPANRLGLAQWLTDPQNPLTARVLVNRWWTEFFGRGIVASISEFGTQGEVPTHPRLLDWLACELIDSGWSRKHTHRLMVMSATYQQSSRVTPEGIARDPNNRWLRRGPRFRLPAETIRDTTLAISGLLTYRIGGPPVYPPQPAGLWRHAGRNAPEYATSRGANRFRRGLYVFWRRAAPYPSFTTFDAPDRASCVVQRPRTNTPLQALTLMNDSAYREMSLALARRMATDDPEMSPAEKVAYGFQLALTRRPNGMEAQQLLEIFTQTRSELEKDIQAACQIIGDWPQGKATPPELAAWFYVAQILLNLDETITKG